MREIKFRAWGTHIVDNQSAFAYEAAESALPRPSDESSFDQWHEDQDAYRTQKRIEWDASHSPDERYTVSHLMLPPTTFGLNGNGLSSRQYGYEVIALMQFTGLKDVNGVEIYEGDVVEQYGYGEDSDYMKKTPQSRHEVSLEIFRLWLKDESLDVELEGLIEPEDCRIIGNIHEHPELLTKEE